MNPNGEKYDHYIQGFLRVARKTTMSTVQQISLSAQWADSVVGPNKKTTATFAKVLSAQDWEWPEFDRMAAVLLRDDRWPMPWHHYEKKIKTGADLRDARSKILIQSARTAAKSFRSSRRPEFIAELILRGWHLYTDSEVGAHYVQMHAETVRPASWQTWPPLYPGDLSRIESGSSGVHSRFGPFLGLGLAHSSRIDPFN